MEKICILDDTKICNDCGSFERCDLDPDKRCDNCMKCIQQSDAEYYEILIDDISKPDPELEKMLKDLLKSKDAENHKKKQ